MVAPEKLASYAALLEASNLLLQAADRHLKQEGNITHAQFEILAILARNAEGLRMTDLAAQVVSSRSRLTYQVTQLQAEGMVTRSKVGGGDPRTVIAKITPAGETIVERLFPDHLALLTENFFSLISVDEAKELAAVLERVASRLRTGSFLE